MFWLIGVFTTYVIIGCLLAWGLSAAGGEKFTLNKASLPFVLTWPKLIWNMFIN